MVWCHVQHLPQALDMKVVGFWISMASCMSVEYNILCVNILNIWLDCLENTNARWALSHRPKGYICNIVRLNHVIMYHHHHRHARLHRHICTLMDHPDLISIAVVLLYIHCLITNDIHCDIFFIFITLVLHVLHMGMPCYLLAA